MADTTPRLQTAPNDLVANYSPLSWYAMGAFVVSIIFAVLLVVLGLSAIIENKPFNESWLLLFPIIGIVLAFAGRRHIRNSEGTRTGEKYANWAWWICLLGALVYGANLIGIGYTIRSDAEGMFTRWTNKLVEADPTNPADTATAEAFYPITDAERRENFSSVDYKKMGALYPTQLPVFRQNKIFAILARNKGQCQFVSDGLQNWEQTPGQLECTLAGTLKTPEGDYPLLVPMLAKTGPKGRAWQIRIPDGYIAEGQGKVVSRTTYGWWMEYLSNSAMTAGVTEIQKAGMPGVAMPKNDFFVLLPSEGGTPKPTLDDLKFCWEPTSAGRVQMPGSFLGFAPDRNPFISIADDKIEVRVPVELRPGFVTKRDSGCRGKLVFQLDDPALIQEIRKAHDEAAKSARTDKMPEELSNRKIPWKLIRLESSLKVEEAPQKAGNPDAG
jgi:hypothetical protein